MKASEIADELKKFEDYFNDWLERQRKRNESICYPSLHIIAELVEVLTVAKKKLNGEEAKSRVGTLQEMQEYPGEFRVHVGVVNETGDVALMIEGVDPPVDPMVYIHTLDAAKRLHESLGLIIQKLEFGMSPEETSKSFKPH